MNIPCYILAGVGFKVETPSYGASVVGGVCLVQAM